MIRGISRFGLLLLPFLAVYGLLTALLGCTTAPEPESSSVEVEYLLRMEPVAGGYRLGSEFDLEAPGNERFEYRGTQGGHVVYHRKVLPGDDRWSFTDLLLHIGPKESVNKIVLLRQFSSLENARLFYDRQYRSQREHYYLAEDSGNSGNIRYARVEAYPDRESWRAAYNRYNEAPREEPFLYYYHPLIARRTASFVYVQGVPTVALIYEGHEYEGGLR